jgi:two-component system response regulator AtoC
MRRVLLIDGQEALRQALLLGLHEHGIFAEAQASISDAALVRGGGAVAAVAMVVLGPTGGSVEDLLATIQSVQSSAAPGGSVGPIDVVALVDGDFALGLRAMEQGACDFVPLALGAAGIALALRKIEARRAHGLSAKRGSEGSSGSGVAPLGVGAGPDVGMAVPAERGKTRPSSVGPVLVGSSPQIAAVLALIRRLAGVRVGVLIGGESGTGKELVAQALHDQSPWRSGPFVAVNCGAIPAGLIESELFGHVRGSFTDAVRDKRGLFQAAHGGTLFLDEIADLPLDLQPKLLRALQEGIIRRVGDVDDVRVDVRVVAATARDLLAEVAGRKFRQDLYYRVAGLTISLPPLRERREDIPLLAEYFLARARARMGLGVRGIDADASLLLGAYAWPGNVRELENTIERAAVLCMGDRIDVASLPERMIPVDRAIAALRSPSLFALAGRTLDDDAVNLSIKQAARRTEEDLIRRALVVTGGNRTRAAELLEISHRALLYKIKEYGIAISPAREAAIAVTGAPISKAPP